MVSPSLQELPPAPSGKSGWPWTECAARFPSRMLGGGKWPRISIVTPSFNQGAFLEETIRSILLQGYPELEYFVVDGGSTDLSLEIIKKYEPWLCGWVSEPDRGQSHAINKGFRRCTGDLMTFQNSDDFYLPGALQDAASIFVENRDLGAVAGGFIFCDSNSVLGGDFVKAELHSASPRDLTLGPPGIYRLHQVATLYSRQVLDEVGRFVDEKLHYVMDREILYRVCQAARIVLSGKCYAAFRVHKHSKSASLILPFAKEFSRLYLGRLTGDCNEDRLRRNMARYRIAAGHLKFAKVTSRKLLRSWHLVLAATHYTPLLRQRSYAGAWARALWHRNRS